MSADCSKYRSLIGKAQGAPTQAHTQINNDAFVTIYAMPSLRTVADVDATGAVNLNHNEPDAPVPASGSPDSRVVPSVLSVAGNVVIAVEKASLRGAAQTNVTAMATLPWNPSVPSTWIE